MKLTGIRKRDDCVQTAAVFDYFLSAPVDEELVRALALNGRLDYFPEFSRPLFKIFCPDGIQIKGLIGDDNFQAVFPESTVSGLKAAFDARLEALATARN